MLLLLLLLFRSAASKGLMVATIVKPEGLRSVSPIPLSLHKPVLSSDLSRSVDGDGGDRSMYISPPPVDFATSSRHFGEAGLEFKMTD